MPRKKKSPPEEPQVISAQVVLRSASGKSIRDQTAISTKNIKDYLPSAADIQAVTTAFARAGFEVSPVVGISFAITAPVSIFEKVFQTRIQRDARGGIKATRTGQAATQELPLQSLPNEITERIEAVTFSPPPDFGPTPSGPW